MQFNITVTPEDFAESVKVCNGYISPNDDILNYCRECVVGRAVERTLRSLGIIPSRLSISFTDGYYDDGFQTVEFGLSDTLVKVRRQFDSHRDEPLTESVHGYITLYNH